MVGAGGRRCGVEYEELHRARVERQQPVGEQFACAGEVFDYFSGLKRSGDAGNGSEHPVLRTGFQCLCLRKHAAVAGRAGQNGHHVARVLVDGSVNEWLSRFHAGIVDKIFDVERIRGIDHDVVVGNNGGGITAVETRRNGRHFHIRIQCCDFFLGRQGFRSADIVGGVNDLPLKIGEVYGVEIGNADVSDACGCQIESYRRTESSRSDNQYTAVEQVLLSGFADFRQPGVVAVRADWRL